MKKVLSVLVATLMLIGCCSVGLVSLAATYTAKPANAADTVAFIAQDTEFLTSSPEATANPGAWNERTFQYGTAGYTFSKTVSASSTKPTETKIDSALGDNLDTVRTAIANAYKEDGSYADYITFSSSNASAMTSIDLATLVADVADISSVLDIIGVDAVASTTIAKSVDASTIIGDDALAKIELDESDVTYSSSALTLASLLLASDDESAELSTVEGSALAKVVKTLISDEVAAQVREALASKEGVTDVKNYSFQISNIKVTPSYNTSVKYSTSENIECMGDTYTKNTNYVGLSALKITYDISFTADLAFDVLAVDGAEDQYFTFTGKKAVTQNYSTIQRPAETDLNVTDIIDLINSKTAEAVTAPTSGYTLTKTVSNATSVKVSDTEDNIALANIVISQYSDRFADYIKDADSSYIDYTGILKDVLGLTAASGTVPKSVDGTEILGDDALIATELSTSDVKSISGSGITGTNIIISFNDVDILASDKASEESVVGDFYNNYVADGLGTSIPESFSSTAKGSTMENLSIKYTNITLNPIFVLNSTTNEYDISELKLTYTVDVSADIYAADTVNAIPVSGAVTVVVDYTAFDAFDSSTDYDAAEFAKYLNDATGYVVSDKAGYDYERNSSITDGPNTSSADTSTTLSDVISTLDSVLAYLSSITGSEAPLTELLSSEISSLVTADMDAEDYTGTVAASKTASDVLGDNYAIKASSVEAKDIYDLTYNAERGVFTFRLADSVDPEKDNGTALSRLTNDFTSVSEMREKLTASLGSLSIDFMEDTDPCSISYTNIDCYVAFNNATEDNPYGDGTLAKLGIGYDCSLDTSAQGIRVTATQIMSSEANNFTYVDYELGDVDQSGKVAIPDAKLVLQYVAGTATLTETQLELADMNQDGKVTVVDAKLILQKIASQVS